MLVAIIISSLIVAAHFKPKDTPEPEPVSIIMASDAEVSAANKPGEFCDRCGGFFKNEKLDTLYQTEINSFDVKTGQETYEWLFSTSTQTVTETGGTYVLSRVAPKPATTRHLCPPCLECEWKKFDEITITTEKESN